MEIRGPLCDPHGSLSHITTEDLVIQVVSDLKSQGLFDVLRKDCIADVDFKSGAASRLCSILRLGNSVECGQFALLSLLPLHTQQPAYQNLRQRVAVSVTDRLNKSGWKPDLSKNKTREMIKKHVFDMHKFEKGIEHIVNQAITAKIYQAFAPQVTEAVHRALGIEPPAYNRAIGQYSNGEIVEADLDEGSEKKIDKSVVSLQDLLPKDLDPISPSEKFDDSDEFGESDFSKKDEPESAFEGFFHDSVDKNIEKSSDDVSPDFEPLDESIDLPSGNAIADLEEISADSSTSLGSHARKNGIVESKSVNSEETSNVTSTEDDIKLSSSPKQCSSLKLSVQDTQELSSEAEAKISVDTSQCSSHHKNTSKPHVDNAEGKKKEDKKRHDDRKKEDDKKKYEDKKKESDNRKTKDKKKEERSDKYDKSRDKDHKKDSRDRKVSESSKKESKDKYHKSSSSSHDSKKHSSKDRHDRDGKNDKDSRSHSSTSSKVKDRDQSHHHKSSSTSRHRDDKSKTEKDTKSDVRHKHDRPKEKSSSDHHSKKSDSKRSDKDGHRDKQKHSESKERSGSHGSSSSSSHRHERRDSKSSKSEDKNKEHTNSSARDAETFKSPSKHEHKHSNKSKDAESPHWKDKQEKEDKALNKSPDKNKIISYDTTQKIKEPSTKVCNVDTDQKDVTATDSKVMSKKPKIAANMYEIKKIIQMRKDFDRMEKNRQKQAEEVKLKEEKKKKEEESKKEKKLEQEEENETIRAQKTDVEMTDLHPQILDTESGNEVQPPEFPDTDDEGVTTLEGIDDYSYISAEVMKELEAKLIDEENLSCISMDSVKSSELSEFQEEEYAIKLNAQEWLNFKQEYPDWVLNDIQECEIPESPKPCNPILIDLTPLATPQEKEVASLTEQIINKSDNMDSSDRAISKPNQSNEIVEKFTSLKPRKKSAARKRRASSDDAIQQLAPPVPEKRFLLPPSPAESAASTETKAERRGDLFDIEEELEKGKDKTVFDGTLEVAQNGLIDSLVPTPPTDIHLTDSTIEDIAIVSPGCTNGETKPLLKKSQAARGRVKRGQGIRRTNIKQQQRYDSSDLYKPRPTFTPSRRLREIAANAKAEAALQEVTQALHITK